MKKTNILLIAILFLTTLNANANYQQPVYQGQASYVMAGTPLSVSLDTTLGTEFSNVGDRFSATLSSPVYAGSQLVAPPGSEVEGFVTEVTPAGRGGKPGSMDLRITNIVTPNGQRIPISASINKTNFKLQADGGRVGQLAKNTAGGAAAGSVTSMLVGTMDGKRGGMGRNAAVGAGMGAIAGLGFGAFKKGRELIIRQGETVPFVVEASTQTNFSPQPTQVQQYGSDFQAGGYQSIPNQQPVYQQPVQTQPSYLPVETPQQAPAGFADPYSAPTQAPAPQAPAPTNYQTQQPYNPYLD
mgnify:CR=1 FL=1